MWYSFFNSGAWDVFCIWCCISVVVCCIGLRSTRWFIWSQSGNVRASCRTDSDAECSLCTQVCRDVLWVADSYLWQLPCPTSCCHRSVVLFVFQPDGFASLTTPAASSRMHTCIGMMSVPSCVYWNRLTRGSTDAASTHSCSSIWGRIMLVLVTVCPSGCLSRVILFNITLVECCWSIHYQCSSVPHMWS